MYAPTCTSAVDHQLVTPALWKHRLLSLSVIPSLRFLLFAWPFRGRVLGRLLKTRGQSGSQEFRTEAEKDIGVEDEGDEELTANA